MSGELPTAAKGLLWPVILLTLAGWVVALVGLASLQRQCPRAGGPGLFGVGNQLPFNLSCGEVYRFHWWILFFEFPILLGIIATTLLGRVYALRTSWLALLAVCTALYMYSTNVMLNLVSTYRNTGIVNDGIERSRWRARTAFAGFLIVSFGNCLLLFLLGMERERHDEYRGTEYNTAGTGATAGAAGHHGKSGPGMFLFGRKNAAGPVATGTTGPAPVAPNANTRVVGHDAVREGPAAV